MCIVLFNNHRLNVQEAKDDWPEDLKDLVNSWDSLPESQTREAVKWFLSSLYPQHPLPHVVRNCHATVSQLFSPSLDQKLEEYSEWLQTEMAPKGKQPVATTPKVIITL